MMRIKERLVFGMLARRRAMVNGPERSGKFPGRVAVTAAIVLKIVSHAAPAIGAHFFVSRYNTVQDT